MPGRILVVDDLPDPRSTVQGILEDAGYVVISVSNKEDALRAVDSDRFHIAILDVRLDEWDEDNRDGLDLMFTINEIDPTIAIIILTGYADVEMVQDALQPDHNGNRPAFGFLNKSEMGQLVDYVQRALKVHVGLIEGLAIDDPSEVIPKLASILRFSQSLKPATQTIIEECQEALGKLFADCTSIEIHPMQEGFSGVAVLKIVPVYRERGKGTECVVKIGERALIEKELKRYETYIKGIGHRLPNALEIARTHSLGGIIYTFAGMGNVRDFTSFFHFANIETIKYALNSLYHETCPHQQGNAGTLNQNKDLCKIYLNQLHLSEAKFNKALGKLINENRSFRKVHHNLKLIYKDGSLLTNPYEFALSANLYCDYFSYIIHGDLYGNNILIDQHNETWLIDFETAGDGPILQDYASLENYVRLYLSDSEQLDNLIKWEKTLFLNDQISPNFPNEENNELVGKIHQTILIIRNLARQTKHFSDRAFLISLLFNALRTTTFLELSSNIREHALLSASLIADRIAKGRAINA